MTIFLILLLETDDNNKSKDSSNSSSSSSSSSEERKSFKTPIKSIEPKMQNKARSEVNQRPKGILKNSQSDSPEKKKNNDSLMRTNQLIETVVNEECVGNSETSKSVQKKRV